MLLVSPLSSSAAGPRRPTSDQRSRSPRPRRRKELEPERRAARSAIGAASGSDLSCSSWAPGDIPAAGLYRAYLEQSDVFIGIVGKQYGWVAPGEEISGLEDENLLAPPTCPRAIYLKSGLPQPKERLGELLTWIRDDETALYTRSRAQTNWPTSSKRTSLLLRPNASERVTLAIGTTGPRGGDRSGRTSPCRDEAVGREQDVATLLESLADDCSGSSRSSAPAGSGRAAAIEVAHSAGGRSIV